MNIEEYADFVTEMASKEHLVDFNSKLTSGSLGLAGESGEIAEIVYNSVNFKKWWCKKVRSSIINELSDVCWYIAFLMRHVVERPLNELEWCLSNSLRISDQTSNIEIGTLALVTKSTKIADSAKKVLFHGLPWDNVKIDFFTNIRFVYQAVHYFADNVVCVDFNDLIEANVKKLKERYKSGTFSNKEFMAKENKD